MFDRLSGDRDTSHLVGAFRRRWWLIVAVALIGGFGAYLLAKEKPKEYSATAALLFRDSNLDQKLFGYQVITNQDPNRTAATNAALVELPAVARVVGGALHMPSRVVTSEISFGSDTTSDVLSVTATDRNPVRAAQVANAYVASYLKFREDADRAQLSQAQHLVTSQLAGIPTGQQNSTLAQGLRQRAFQLQLLASLQTGNAEVVQTAVPPRSPSAPTPVRDGILGLILGVIVSCGLILVMERRDRRIKSRAEAEAVYGVPIIGSVPESSTLRKPGAVGTLREQDAFKMIRAQLRYFDVDRDVKRLMVTSADAREGKSLVTLNLARAVVPSEGRRTLLIETDLRRPSVSEMLGVQSVAGLSELLGHAHDIESTFRELVVTPEDEHGRAADFDVLLAGGIPPNPVALLESRRMTEVLEYANSLYELVIIDTPPIGVVSDAIALVHQVDGVVVVTRVGYSRRDHAARLMNQLKGLGASVLGVVVNGTEEGSADYYGYGYYSRDEPEVSGRFRPTRLMQTGKGRRE